ncbi:MAG TPA: aldo/keto reductase [Anaeromyxobacteraceae bacterium]|nr:aldo/keto reductase [Anaeromyxobacteraceae bacterium]
MGRTGIEISTIGLGCWQFSQGGGLAGRYWPPIPQETVDVIVAASLRAGVNWFDTAEAYGRGRSERALARALATAGRQPGDVVVATKWFPILRRASSLVETVGDRIAALAPYPIDLHQVHHWASLSSVGAVMHAMAGLVRSGKIRTVGVSNFSAGRMRRAHAALAREGIPLAANQVRMSLLDRSAERNGVVAAAKDLGVTLIAYSPLAQGALSGRFHDDPSLAAHLGWPRRLQSAFRGRALAASRPLIEELKRIAAAHGATPSQVALAWLVQFYGDPVVAIPGATRVAQAEENARAMALNLSEREMRTLDEISRRVTGDGR